jgi:hypothetical protein
MEQTSDVINDEFTVPGGSGIRSDGLYHWRQARSSTWMSTWIPSQCDGWLWDLAIPGGNDHDF